MFGWIKCIALIVGTISFFRWVYAYKPMKTYKRPDGEGARIIW